MELAHSTIQACTQLLCDLREWSPKATLFKASNAPATSKVNSCEESVGWAIPQRLKLCAMTSSAAACAFEFVTASITWCRTSPCLSRRCRSRPTITHIVPVQSSQYNQLARSTQQLQRTQQHSVQFTKTCPKMTKKRLPTLRGGQLPSKKPMFACKAISCRSV